MPTLVSVSQLFTGSLMFKFCSNFNGVQALNFIPGFHHFLLYSTSTAMNPSFVNYLVEFLGFSNKQALSTSIKLAHFRQVRGTKYFACFNFLENASSVITYLKQIGLQQSEIAKTIHSRPQILLCRVDKTLKPKTETFLKLGFSTSDFVEVVKANPALYDLGANTIIVPAIQSLTEILGCKSHVIKLLKEKRGIRLSSVSKTLVPNVALLRSYGIPLESIRKRVLVSPHSFMLNTLTYEDTVIRVEEKLGIAKNSPSFLSGVHLLTNVRDTSLDSKIRVFKSFGWTESDVVALARLVPLCLGLSEATLRKKLSFLMNELGYEPKYVASRSALMTCSLEKRLVPRHKVLLVLKEQGLLAMDFLFYNVVCLKESLFLKRFVLPFKEVHEVYCKHAGISLKMLALESSKLNSDAA